MPRKLVVGRSNNGFSRMSSYQCCRVPSTNEITTIDSTLSLQCGAGILLASTSNLQLSLICLPIICSSQHSDIYNMKLALFSLAIASASAFAPKATIQKSSSLSAGWENEVGVQPPVCSGRAQTVRSTSSQPSVNSFVYID